MAKHFHPGLIAVATLLILPALLPGCGGSSPTSMPSDREGGESSELVSEAKLREAAKEAGYPLYWAGPRSDVKYELISNHDAESRIYLRYLPKSEKAGTKRHFLTVGSYQIGDAYGSINRVARQQRGSILVKVPGGGEAYAVGPHRAEAYLVFPGVGTEIEVYHPHPGTALRLIRAGTIVPID
jgi:hypothetical protein